VTTRLSLSIALVAVAACSLAQLPAPALKPVVAPRMPSLSPDGSQVAFVHKGDIWVAPSSGGRAHALTRNVEMDAYPQFSPDGKWVAFSSMRMGNWDVFVIPADGGAPTRLTWCSSSDIAYGWSPDGKRVIFAAGRETGENELLTLDVKTLKIKKLTQDYESINHPGFSPDGKSVVFGRRGFHWSRPRYHGSAAMQIVVIDVATGKRNEVTDDGKQHLWTRFMPDGKTLVTVTYKDVTPSSHKLGEDPGKEAGSTGPPTGVSLPAPPAGPRPAGPPGSPEWKAEQAAKAKAGHKAGGAGSGTTSPSPK
jgi:Tol biopolymer transport system component